MQAKQPKLTFSPKALPLLLKAFGKAVNEKGVIIDTETGDPILTPEGEEITNDNFGGIKKGSFIFLKEDLLTAIKLTEGKY